MTNLQEAVRAFEKAHDDHAQLELDYNAKRAEIMARIADELNALEMEFRPYLDEADKRKAEAETELRAAVLIAKQSVRGRFVTASIVKPRVTWDTVTVQRLGKSV